ncbi:MAG: winged helix-turn-helix domain-containing protein [Terracidiphilus sp.]
MQNRQIKRAHGASKNSRRRHAVNLLLVGSDGAFASDASRKFLDDLHLHVVARASDLSDAAACLSSGAIDLLLLSNEFSEERLSLFARALRCRGFVGLMLQSADSPGIVPQPAEIEANEIRAGDFAVDLSTRQIWLRGVEVPCTPKEFALLTFLCKHPEEPLSYRTLLAAVWGNPANSSHALRVLIRSIRAKIESTTSPRYIVTMHRLGYRFCPSPKLQ